MSARRLLLQWLLDIMRMSLILCHAVTIIDQLFYFFMNSYIIVCSYGFFNSTLLKYCTINWKHSQFRNSILAANGEEAKQWRCCRSFWKLAYFYLKSFYSFFRKARCACVESEKFQFLSFFIKVYEQHLSSVQSLID